MKKLSVICAALMLPSLAGAVEKPYDYVFFDNSRMPGNYFYSRTDYRSPSFLKNSSSRLPVSDMCFSPGNSLELTYVSAKGGAWTAEVQYAPVRGNDFFRKPEVLSMNVLIGDDATGALPDVALRYAALPPAGYDFTVERDPVKADTVLTAYVSLSDYVRPSSGWQHVAIPFSDLGLEGFDDSNIKSIVAVSLRQSTADGKQHTRYIDDVELLPSELPSGPVTAPFIKDAKGYERHIDISWNATASDGLKYYKIYRSTDGINFEPIGISRPWMHRYTDYIGKTGQRAWYRVSEVGYDQKESPLSETAEATTRPMTDDELLDMVQEAQFRYYWDGAEPTSGLARENIPGRGDMIAAGASGFGMMATIVGVDRGFITREEGVERFLKITSFLERADRFHGAYAHFMDGTTGKVELFFGGKDNGADLVETSFMFQGLLAARQYFDGDNQDETLIRNRIDRLWKEIEWSWFKQTADSPYLYWHWSPDQEWIIHHPLIGWNETMITYMLAIMSPTYGVAPEMYYSGWASQQKLAHDYRAGWGMTEDGSAYTNGNTYYGIKLDVGVSNGGPLFFTHYSFLGLDPHKVTDRYTNYFDNNRNIALINHRYCMQNPGKYAGYGYDCWGLTASDDAWEYHAREPQPYHDNGTMAPTGALASFPYTPEESMAALKNYYRNYGSFLWGEYGFLDAFNVSTNWVSPLYMGLNQGPVVVMIENYRTGLIWNLFMSHPDVQRGLKALDAIR